ncbi:cytochrome P450 [Cylindrobasidium torrendii FP15055 ss-10]|uniref:Cytochrome P450 n=1 Tax=Cylindrobasidium torrendii FP15055 ss-10 TaxID=1314674 RepID=A0A0D7BC53_9AGAR|nr:cytochrome P450 [Cylindrobasidium torrendii FP15055 ss-10]
MAFDSVWLAVAVVPIGFLLFHWASAGYPRLPSYIPGPPSRSWIAGHAVDLWNKQEQAGDLEFAWFKQYGATIKTKGTFGTEILLTSDAKAIHYVLHTSAYRFEKAPEAVISITAVNGKGVIAVNGKTHQRHRKVLSPAFSEIQLRTFMPVFQSVANTLTKTIRAAIERDGGIVDVHHWLGRASLDIIGESSAFNYKFNSLEDENCEMANIMSHLMDGASAMTEPLRVGLWLMEKFPLLQGLVDYSPADLHRHMVKFKKLARELGKIIVDKAKQSSTDTSAKDILSILVRANESEDSSKKLSEDEVLNQTATLLSAGQETTSSTLTWVLYELSKCPDAQHALRKEIREVRSRVGDGPLTQQDYDSMEMLNAVIKETLRFHPILGTMLRVASFDDIIPLAEPIITPDGQTISQIPVQKGQLVECAAHGYNRNPAVWGSDAHIWRPERWLTKQEAQVTVGMHANVLSFSGGVRGCSGWRFAMMSMQSITFELIENFYFEPSEAICRRPGLLITPHLAARVEEGVKLPLRVTEV